MNRLPDDFWDFIMLLAFAASVVTIAIWVFIR